MEAGEERDALPAAWKAWRGVLAAASQGASAAGGGSLAGLALASNELYSLLAPGHTSSALELWRSVSRCGQVELVRCRRPHTAAPPLEFQARPALAVRAQRGLSAMPVPILITNTPPCAALFLRCCATCRALPRRAAGTLISRRRQWQRFGHSQRWRHCQAM